MIGKKWVFFVGMIFFVPIVLAQGTAPAWSEVVRSFYKEYGLLLEWFVYFLFFLAYLPKYVQRFLEGRASVVLSVVTALVLAISIALTELKSGISLLEGGVLGVFVLVCLAGLSVVVLYKEKVKDEDTFSASLSLIFVLMLLVVLGYLVFPSFFVQIGNVEYFLVFVLGVLALLALRSIVRYAKKSRREKSEVGEYALPFVVVCLIGLGVMVAAGGVGVGVYVLLLGLFLLGAFLWKKKDASSASVHPQHSFPNLQSGAPSPLPPLKQGDLKVRILVNKERSLLTKKCSYGKGITLDLSAFVEGGSGLYAYRWSAFGMNGALPQEPEFKLMVDNFRMESKKEVKKVKVEVFDKRTGRKAQDSVSIFLVWEKARLKIVSPGSEKEAKYVGTLDIRFVKEGGGEREIIVEGGKEKQSKKEVMEHGVRNPVRVVVGAIDKERGICQGIVIDNPEHGVVYTLVVKGVDDQRRVVGEMVDVCYVHIPFEKPKVKIKASSPKKAFEFEKDKDGNVTLVRPKRVKFEVEVVDRGAQIDKYVWKVLEPGYTNVEKGGVVVGKGKSMYADALGKVFMPNKRGETKICELAVLAYAKKKWFEKRELLATDVYAVKLGVTIKLSYP